MDHTGLLHCNAPILTLPVWTIASSLNDLRSPLIVPLGQKEFWSSAEAACLLLHSDQRQRCLQLSSPLHPPQPTCRYKELMVTVLQVERLEAEVAAAQAETARQLAAASDEAERASVQAVSYAVAAARTEAQEAAQGKADVRVAKLKKQLQLQNTELDTLQDEVTGLRTELAEVRPPCAHTCISGEVRGAGGVGAVLSHPYAMYAPYAMYDLYLR